MKQHAHLGNPNHGQVQFLRALQREFMKSPDGESHSSSPSIFLEPIKRIQAHTDSLVCKGRDEAPCGLQAAVASLVATMVPASVSQEVRLVGDVSEMIGASMRAHLKHHTSLSVHLLLTSCPVSFSQEQTGGYR